MKENVDVIFSSYQPNFDNHSAPFRYYAVLYPPTFTIYNTQSISATLCNTDLTTP